MKIAFILICFLSFGALNSQTLSQFGAIPDSIQHSTNTNDLLSQLKWRSIREFCKKNEGFYAYKRSKGVLVTYSYIKQGREESFEITSYKGKVLEFYFDIPKSNRANESFFDKQLWLSYVQEKIPDLPKNLLLTESDPVDLLKGLYSLLGIGATDEYGWICEYSTVGMAPKKREGVITLVKHKRVDLLKILMNHTNPQIKLYAIDALIYLDKTSKVLNKNDWHKIYEFRDSGVTVKTCGNMGSYKIYKTPVSELLSKRAIKKIIRRYKSLASLGYI